MRKAWIILFVLLSGYLRAQTYDKPSEAKNELGAVLVENKLEELKSDNLSKQEQEKRKLTDEGYAQSLNSEYIGLIAGSKFGLEMPMRCPGMQANPSAVMFHNASSSFINAERWIKRSSDFAIDDIFTEENKKILEEKDKSLVWEEVEVNPETNETKKVIKFVDSSAQYRGLLLAAKIVESQAVVSMTKYNLMTGVHASFLRAADAAKGKSLEPLSLVVPLVCVADSISGTGAIETQSKTTTIEDELGIITDDQKDAIADLIKNYRFQVITPWDRYAFFSDMAKRALKVQQSLIGYSAEYYNRAQDYKKQANELIKIDQTGKFKDQLVEVKPKLGVGSGPAEVEVAIAGVDQQFMQDMANENNKLCLVDADRNSVMVDKNCSCEKQNNCHGPIEKISHFGVQSDKKEDLSLPVMDSAVIQYLDQNTNFAKAVGQSDLKRIQSMNTSNKKFALRHKKIVDDTEFSKIIDQKIKESPHYNGEKSLYSYKKQQMQKGIHRILSKVIDIPLKARSEQIELLSLDFNSKTKDFTGETTLIKNQVTTTDQQKTSTTDKSKNASEKQIIRMPASVSEYLIDPDRNLSDGEKILIINNVDSYDYNSQFGEALFDQISKVYMKTAYKKLLVPYRN